MYQKIFIFLTVALVIYYIVMIFLDMKKADALKETEKDKEIEKEVDISDEVENFNTVEVKREEPKPAPKPRQPKKEKRNQEKKPEPQKPTPPTSEPQQQAAPAPNQGMTARVTETPNAENQDKKAERPSEAPVEVPSGTATEAKEAEVPPENPQPKSRIIEPAAIGGLSVDELYAEAELLASNKDSKLSEMITMWYVQEE